jgi:glutamate N-acetyltransferase/amino-acid N-acetyltransferase
MTKDQRWSRNDRIGERVSGGGGGVRDQAGKPDLAVLVCPKSATAAAMFTTNRVVSAAVTVCREHGGPQGRVVINSGNASMHGDQGAGRCPDDVRLWPAS